MKYLLFSNDKIYNSSAPILRVTTAATAKGAGVSSTSSDEDRSSGNVTAVFEDQSLGWTIITTESKIPIPRQFTIDKIAEYLTYIPVSLLALGEDSGDESEADAGTKKPTAKGDLSP